MKRLTQQKIQITEQLKQLAVFLVTLPWLTVFAGWTLITIITLLTNTSVDLNETIPGDFTGVLSYLSAWLLATAVYITSLLLNFKYFQENRTHAVISISLILLVFLGYLFIIYPEFQSYLSSKNL